MKKELLKAVAVSLVIAILTPQVAMATPISGADSDLGAFWMDATSDVTDANDADADDVDWPVSNGTVVYFGSTSKFQRIYFYITGEGVSSSWTPGTEFQYSMGGDSWSSLSVTNATGAWNADGIHYFSFTPPTDWATTSVNSEGGSYYYVRIYACDAGCSQSNGGFLMDQISLLSYGASVPEFSDLAYILVLAIGGALVLTREAFGSGVAKA